MPKNYAVLDILGTASLKADQSANREVEKRLLKILEAKKFESMQQYVAQSRSLKNTAARQHLQPVTGLLQPKTMSALKERFGGACQWAGHLEEKKPQASTVDVRPYFQRLSAPTPPETQKFESMQRYF